jgi:hypothetical protein
MQTSTLISGPLSLGDLLDRTFRLFRARVGILTLTAAILLVPVGLLSSVVTGRFMVGYMDLLQGLAVETSPFETETALLEGMGNILSYAGWIFLISLLNMAALALASLTTSVHAVDFLHGQERTLGQGLRTAMGRFWALIGLFVLRAIAIAGATLGVLIVLGVVFFLLFIILSGAAFIFADDSGGPTSAVAIIGVVILFMCLYLLMILLVVAPVIYLSARWIAAVPGLVAERLGPIAAMQRSWELTQRGVWRVIGYFVLLGLLSIIVISLPVSVVQQILIFLSPLPMDVSFGISAAIGSIVSVFWQPLYAIALVLLYYDLRVRRESYDLTLRVEQLEADVREMQL